MKRLPLLLAAALPLAACSKGGAASLPAAPAASAGEAAAVGVKIVKPKGDASAALRATGELHARNEASLAPEISGRILRFRADVGDRVKKGDALVELDDATARAQLQASRAGLAAAEAAHDNAVSNLRRVKDLAQGEAASPATLDQATIGERQAAAARDQAAASVSLAEVQLSKHVLRAPFDGIVTSRTKSAGEYVANMPPTPVMALVDVASIEIRAAVPETVVDLLSPGARLDAAVSPSGKRFEARVRAIGANVEPGTRTVDVRAEPVGALLKELRPGAIVEVSLSGKSAQVEGVFLPSVVVQRGNAGPFVWAVKGDRLERRDVTVQPLDPGTVRVLSGVTAADVVVAEGGAGLADGAKVRVLQ